MIELHINIHTLKPCHLARKYYTELFINERTNFWLMNDHCFNITSLQGCGTVTAMTLHRIVSQAQEPI